MFLKTLEIQGFKSFPQKIKLDFKKNITAIVGPNGSGKSNISDAIRWVIGEQSPKSLRGQTMEDIIFNGTKNRKPLNFSEVSITLDNSDKKLKIDFDEIIITRKLYRSGESSFLINGSNCRLKDIQELFLDTGIGKEGYSIISQGKIDSILSNKLEDKRVLFEEAVGIVKFKTRKQQAESKLNEVQKNLIRINDIITEMENHLQPLKQQADKTKKYLSLYENLKQIKINLFVYNYKNFEKENLSILDNIQSFSNEIQSLEKQKQDINNKKQDFEISMQNIQSKLKNLNENLNDFTSSINENKKQISLNLNSFEFIKNEINRLEIEIRNIDLDISSKIKNISLIKSTIQSKNMELSVKQSFQKSLSEQFDSYNLKVNQNIQIINDYNLKVLDKLQEFNSLKQKISELNLFESQFKEQYNQYKTQINLTKSYIKEKEVRNEVLKCEFNSVINQEDLIKNNLIKEQIIFSDLNSKNNQLLIKKDNLNSEYINLKNKIEFLNQLQKDFNGYNNSVKAILTNIKKEEFKGICGIISQLISVPQKFEISIEIALGSYIQNIVTKTEEDAKYAIKYLKKNNKGRATFLPISTIKSKIISEKLKQEFLKYPGFLGIASELITFEEKYFNIISNILGKVLIFDNINNAIIFSKKYGNIYKLVTIEGDIINTNGSLTGGSNFKKQTSFLSRNREIKELKSSALNIETQIKQIKTQCNLNQEHIHKLKISIEQKNNDLQSINLQKAQLNTKLKENLTYLEELKNNVILQEKEIQTYKANFSQNTSNIEKYKKDLCILQEQIDNLKQKISSLQKENQEQAIFTNEKNQELTNIKIEINSILHQVSTNQQEIQRLNLEISQNKTKKDSLNSQLLKNNNELQKIDNDNQNISLKIQKLQEKYSECNYFYQSLQRKKDEQEDKIQDLNKKYIDLTNLIYNLNNKKNKLELKSKNIEDSIQQIANYIWDKYEVTYATAYEKYFDKNLNIKELKNKEEYLKSSINSLGQVNVLAIDEYNSLKDRYNINIMQRDDIIKAQSDLKEIIKNLTIQMENQFKQQFDLINKNFSSIFSQIFGGGTANLVLTDKENVLQSNIDIIAQPPGKKLQSLILLSGGERTLTAISLLFSILKLRSSPFCILDETEAALDDSNVIRYANFIKKFSKENQFILITHKVGTMQIADTLYGITMEEQGISKLISVNLE